MQQLLPQLSGPLLHVWSTHVADPLVSEDALDVLSALAQHPGCLEPLTQQVWGQCGRREGTNFSGVLSAV